MPSDDTQMAQHRNKAKAVAEDLKQNKTKILTDLQDLLAAERYEKVLIYAKTYKQLNDKDLTAITNKAEEQVLLKKTKLLPASRVNANRAGYAKLMKLNPNEPTYKKKFKYYDNKVKAEEKRNAAKRAKKQARIAKFGKLPTQSGWNGSYYVVKSYLKKVANDPKSIEMDGCTAVYYTENGWLVGCDYRGRNGFGGMVRNSNWFVIVHNTVIDVKPASAYTR